MNSSDAKDRERFYLRFVEFYIDQLFGDSGIILSRVPVILSGMASSSIGMRELPYAQTPFPLDGAGIIASRIEGQHRPILLVSGLQSQHEVMRGEEIQLIGLESTIHAMEQPGSMCTVLLPGTHSKHVSIQNGRVVHFSTAMTGELFDLLTSKGLLSHSVAPPTNPPRRPDYQCFRKGVQHATQQSLLHALFRVRTNELFHEFTPEENYYFLSGLLIGAELGDLSKLPTIPILLCCPAHLADFYNHAIEELGLKDRSHQISTDDFNRLTVASQIKIADRFNL